jgi:hypothetical protein
MRREKIVGKPLAEFTFRYRLMLFKGIKPVVRAGLYQIHIMLRAAGRIFIRGANNIGHAVGWPGYCWRLIRHIFA